MKPALVVRWRGREWGLRELSQSTGVERSILYTRIFKLGWSVKEAVNTPRRLQRARTLKPPSEKKLETLRAHFNAHLIEHPKGGHWEIGKRADGGEVYFRIRENKDSNYGTTARSVSWVLHRGELPAGAHVEPTCGKWWCIAPDHLALRGALRSVTIGGRTQTLGEWADEVGLPREFVLARWQRGWRGCDLLCTPRRGHR